MSVRLQRTVAFAAAAAAAAAAMHNDVIIVLFACSCSSSFIPWRGVLSDQWHGPGCAGHGGVLVQLH